MRNIPGQKPDQKDSEWISDLVAHGLLRPSFVPPRPIQDLRDLTRYRAKLAGECNRVHNRIAKILEDANVKLGSVASDILEVTGQRVIKGDYRRPGTSGLAGRQRLRNLARQAESSCVWF